VGVRGFLDSRLKVILPVALVAVLVAAGLIVLHIDQNSSRSTNKHISASPSNSPSASSTKAAAAISAIDDYPPSRFQSGRPSSVTGLKVLSVDSAKKTINLSWDPSPIGEGVDSYALYYYSNDSLFPSASRVGVLAAVVKTNSLTTQIVGTSAGLNVSDQPYGQDEVTTCDDPNNCNTLNQISIWVLAHNKNGWSDNDWSTPNPDENPADFSPLSIHEESLVKTPPISTFSLSDLFPGFTPGEVPIYDGKNDVSNLSNTPPTNTPWVVQWVPPLNDPACRFQPGRPSIVLGLKLVSIDQKNKILTLNWKANPASEKVDQYAVYAEGTNCADDFCATSLLKIVSGNSLVEPINFRGTTAFNDPTDTPGYVSFTSGDLYYFYVIAHNKNGWGDNDPQTPNPDQNGNDFRALTPNQIAQQDSDPPTQIRVTSP